MENKHSDAPSTNASQDTEKKCIFCRMMPFIVGLVVALVFGWGIFPGLMFSKEEQPVNFGHTRHVIGASLQCSVCHSVRADGSFTGIPTIADCAVCHDRLMSGSAAEVAFVDEYVLQDKEVKWKVYQKQPDNVFFSHAAHSLQTCNTCHVFVEKELCGKCHIPVFNENKIPALEENWLTGYATTTLKMWECEQCHANPNHLGINNASNACFVCHK